MANSRASGATYEYATVDSNPGSAGYFTNPVCVRDLVKRGADRIFFSIREKDADISANPSALSAVTVVLQYLCPGDSAWTDYVPLGGSSFATGNLVEIPDMGTGRMWRAGVRDDEYTSGSVTFGFDW